VRLGAFHAGDGVAVGLEGGGLPPVGAGGVLGFLEEFGEGLGEDGGVAFLGEGVGVAEDDEVHAETFLWAEFKYTNQCHTAFSDLTNTKTEEWRDDLCTAIF